jgi:hypothetical protein
VPIVPAASLSFEHWEVLTYRLAIACDDNRMPSNRLRHRSCDGSVFLNAFDLIELKGDDLRFRSTRDKSLCD